MDLHSLATKEFEAKSEHLDIYIYIYIDGEIVR